MKVTSDLLRFTGATLILAFCATAAQGQSRTIELQTDEGLLTIPLEDTTRLQLLSDGNISATAEQGFICQQGDSCEDVEVSLSGTDGGAFSLSKSTVTQGIDFQVSWDARGAWDCTGSGLSGTVWNSDNPKLPSGTQKVSTDGLSTGTHQVEIVCENGPASAAGALTLTIEEPTGEIAGCEDVPSLADFDGWARATDVKDPWNSDEEQTFENVFSEWPGTGNTFLVGIPKGEFMALSFNSGPLTSSSDGSLAPEAPQGTSLIGEDEFIVSWSKCPGDFDPDSTAVATGCVQKIRPWVDNPFWGGVGSTKTCQLEANTDYYLNIVYTQDSVGTLPPTQAPCDGAARCGNAYVPVGDF